MAEPLLTAAMITRDEESRLEACLRSIRDVVDEIVIVDTGSSDRTVEIARSFGARVRLHPWHGDFAQARNVGLDLARGRWILYIDADERLRPISREAVRSALARAREVALRVRLRPMVGATPYWEYRLWRSDPRIRFVGAMHEKVTIAIRDVAEQDRVPIGESELFLEHVGYEGDQTHKHHRNLPLLRAQLARDPVDAYSWHHLAAVLDALGDRDESDAALDRAVEVARDTGATAGVLGFLRRIARLRDQGRDSTELLQEALGRYPDSIALAWLQLISEIEAGNHEHALRRLELFDVDPEMPVEDTSSYPAEMFGVWAAQARGLCLFKLGRYREAAAAYARAEELEPDEPAHRLRRIVAEHRAAQQLDSPRPSRESAAAWHARSAVSGLSVEIGGISVGLAATDAMRAAAMRSLLGRTLPTERKPEVRLTFGGHRVAPPDRDPDDSAGPLRIWYDDGALSIAYGDSVGGRVESGIGTVGGETQHLAVIFRQLAPFMLASLLAPHDRFLLHGGAIQRDGRAVIVLGGTGTGKSTLVFGALEQGWRVLADDLVVVRAGASGPQVTGVQKPLAVPEEVLDGGRSFPPQPVDPRTRVEVPVESWERGWHPVSMVVIAGHGNRVETLLEPVERPERLGMLLHSMLSHAPRWTRAYMPVAISLCDLPGYRVLHSRAPQVRARQAAEIIAASLPG